MKVICLLCHTLSTSLILQAVMQTQSLLTFSTHSFVVLWLNDFEQRIFNYVTKRNISVQADRLFDGLDSTKQVNLLLLQLKKSS